MYLMDFSIYQPLSTPFMFFQHFNIFNIFNISTFFNVFNIFNVFNVFNVFQHFSTSPGFFNMLEHLSTCFTICQDVATFPIFPAFSTCSAFSTCFGIFSNSNKFQHFQHVPDSPLCFNIPNTFQHSQHVPTFLNMFQHSNMLHHVSRFSQFPQHCGVLRTLAAFDRVLLRFAKFCGTLRWFPSCGASAYSGIFIIYRF